MLTAATTTTRATHMLSTSAGGYTTTTTRAVVTSLIRQYSVDMRRHRYRTTLPADVRPLASRYDIQVWGWG